MRNITEMKETLISELKSKTSFDEVDLIADVLINVICDVFAGDNVYIPNRKTSVTHEKIRSKFNGNNQAELAKMFGYTSRTIYQILRKNKAKQNDLI